MITKNQESFGKIIQFPGSAKSLPGKPTADVSAGETGMTGEIIIPANAMMPPGGATAEGRRRAKDDDDYWRLHYLSQTNELEHFERILWSLCSLMEDFEQRRGRPRLDIKELLFSLMSRTYNAKGQSSRTVVSNLKCNQKGKYLSSIPSHGSMSNYLKMTELTDVLQSMLTVSSLPLVAVEESFSIDSSKFGTPNFKRMENVKYGNTEQWRVKVKLHAMCGNRTHVITSARVTDGDSHDISFFGELFEQTRHFFDVRDLCADKGYSSYKNIELVMKAGVMPYISFKHNARGDSANEFWNWAFHYFSLYRAEYLEKYHQRSNVESLFASMKGRFGRILRTKTFDRQINELLCMAICHNLCVLVKAMYQLGIEPTDYFRNLGGN